MNKVQKFEQTKSIEGYLEENQVFEMFKGLMKQLLVNKPDKPLDFLIDKLSSEPVKRVFLMGPPGSERQQTAESIGTLNAWHVINTGEILRKEIVKTSDAGMEIQESFNKHEYVSDDVVIPLIEKEIIKCENDNQSWIVQGFPRTKRQALALQKIGIIPDKLVLLNQSEPKIVGRIEKVLIENNSKFIGHELNVQAHRGLQEYKLHLAGVREIFNDFIYELDSTDQHQQQVESKLSRMLALRVGKGAPRRPPKILILGPPGAGKYTQAAELSSKFGLVHISSRDLLLNFAKENPPRAKYIKRHLESGGLYPEEIINQLIEQRIQKPDCRINGFVLEGYPQTQSQLNHLTAMRINPNIVFQFEQTQVDANRRLSKKRIDPLTGNVYNLNVDLIRDDALKSRLVQRDCDGKQSVAVGFRLWNEHLAAIEEFFGKNLIVIPVDGKSIQETGDHLNEVIQSNQIASTPLQ